ncbi:MAG: hypothetical protein RIC81_01335 [Microcella pacifica]|uniref:hypothetical protein n=1 Tax=Microcella pacifica TaxID=2591847 RepID=UPI003315D80A
MTSDTAHDRDHDESHEPHSDLMADEYQQVDLSGAEGGADQSGGVEGTDPDLTVPGASDTAESGGRGADDRYVEGELGGGAIGAELEDDETEGDEA